MGLTTKWQGNKAFTMANESGNELKMDSVEEFGGEGKGVTPMEALLGALSGCMGIDAVSILKPHLKKITNLEIAADGVRNEGTPKFYTAIEVTFVVDGEVEAKKVWRAIRLSADKYCSVGFSLGAELSYRLILNGMEIKETV